MSIDARAGSELCATCGLCCDGSLFARAKLEEAEMGSVAAAGLTTEQSGGKFYFQLGCPRLSGTKCTIYPDRFSICRSFQCKLLNQYLNGSVTLPQAQATISTAKKMLAELAAEIPGARYLVERRRLMREAASWKLALDRDKAARRFLGLVSLERFLTRRFRNDRSPLPRISE